MSVRPPRSRAQGLSTEEISSFQQDGFLVLRGLADSALCDRIRQVSLEHLARSVEPVEYEAVLGYPGAPSSLDSEGGRTIRRLQQALSRDPAFLEWATHPSVLCRLHQLLGPELVLPLAHHNCVMTKDPRYSSQTGWHQDFRYWSFRRAELVNVWLALGREDNESGGLALIPGSHRVAIAEDRLDEDQFFCDDLPNNRPLIDDGQYVSLEAGDVVFFHCRTLHSAGRNTSDQVKLSAVFTYRSADNPPLPGSRSSSLPELLLPSA